MGSMDNEEQAAEAVVESNLTLLASLPEPIREAVEAKGFESLTAVQEAVLAPEALGRDLQVSSQTGSGKTLALGLVVAPALFEVSEQAPLVLVLAPTRDLALQIEKEMKAIGAFMGISTIAAIGGTGVRAMGDRLRAGVHVVVGTPGRLKDVIERRHLRCDDVRMIVLDEADDLLSRGFRDQIYDIFQLLPSSTRVGLFSATLPPDVMDLTEKFMAPDAVRILVKRELQTLDGIKQYYVDVQHEQRREPRPGHDSRRAPGAHAGAVTAPARPARRTKRPRASSSPRPASARSPWRRRRRDHVRRTARPRTGRGTRRRPRSRPSGRRAPRPAP